MYLYSIYFGLQAVLLLFRAKVAAFHAGATKFSLRIPEGFGIVDVL